MFMLILTVAGLVALAVLVVAAILLCCWSAQRSLRRGNLFGWYSSTEALKVLCEVLCVILVAICNAVADSSK